jgi:hypothetical protein
MDLSVTERIIDWKLNKADAPGPQPYGGDERAFTDLRLHLGQTTLIREAFPDGSAGPVKIYTNLFRPLNNSGNMLPLAESYLLEDGTLRRADNMRRVGNFELARTLAKVVIGKKVKSA